MQKLINVLAVSSFVVSAGIVAAGFTAYFYREAIIEGAKEKVVEEVSSMIPDMISGSLGGSLTEDVSIPTLPGLPF